METTNFPSDLYSKGFNGTFAPIDSHIITGGAVNLKKETNQKILCKSNSGYKELGKFQNQNEENSQVSDYDLDSIVRTEQSHLSVCDYQRDLHVNGDQNEIDSPVSNDKTHLYETNINSINTDRNKLPYNTQTDLTVENDHSNSPVYKNEQDGLSLYKDQCDLPVGNDQGDLPVNNEMVQKYLNQEELNGSGDNSGSFDQGKRDLGSIDSEKDTEKKLCVTLSCVKKVKCNSEFSNQISPCSEALKLQQDLDPAKYGPNGNLDNRCEVCGKTFSQPYLLKVHFRIHTGYKPYRCKLCDKGFAQSSGLRSHMLTHTGEKPYKCDICGKTFTASGSLTMHYRTHNGERPFPCEICGRTFRYRSAMNKHTMIHTGDRPYTCSDCGKDFSRKGNLETHRRIHTNVTPYQCDVCQKKFNQMSNLKTHQLIHSTVKPYKCDLCGSEFYTKFNMQRHIVIQHIKNKR